MFGRSIGATCAVHLAAKSQKVHGLIVDSGLMSIKQLPTVQMSLEAAYMPLFPRGRVCPLVSCTGSISSYNLRISMDILGRNS